MQQRLEDLRKELKGELAWDDLHKSIYATDASVYHRLPQAVCYPKDREDLKTLLRFARENGTSLILRTAGTSLAGQCVGSGIVVDVSRHFTRILAFDERNMTVKVEPGVIRDELNDYLKPFGLHFGPNTSTSNRCMIGGMVGNNSSGTTSIKFGTTRDKIEAITTLLSDGSEVVFEDLDKKGFTAKQKGNSLESKIYSGLYRELSNDETRLEIEKQFPRKTIHRRNGGYAVDALMDTDPFCENDLPANLGKILCGSEGTLAITLDITLKLNKLPPSYKILVAAHFNSIEESLKAVVVAMNHDLYMCELMDKTILDCTRNNREQARNRFFVEGDPEAILMLELCGESEEEVAELSRNLIKDLEKEGFGYAFPELRGEDISRAFSLRKAGLGLLGNMVGDAKAVACIEDTAVDVPDLPAYITEFSAMMDRHQQKAVYYAHAGAGELHLRPILDLKKSGDVRLFRQITTEVAQLVKKYGGSMSGEHGDGLVRSEFLPLMVGDKNYALFKRIKQLFDPNNLLNPGKIVDPEPMDTSLRYVADREEPEIDTLMDFSDSQGILRAAEKCNGSGDCRKSMSAGGTMCPSYRATKHEKDSTRARANALRDFLTSSHKEDNPFDHNSLKEVFDLCLSCKACASECPSNVDVAALKAEFLYQYQKKNGIRLRNRLFGENAKWNKIGSAVPGVTNGIMNMRLTKRLLGIAEKRSIPRLKGLTTRKWYARNRQRLDRQASPMGSVHLFIDEFTNYYDSEVGIDCIELLTGLGYRVHVTDHAESGRSYISKGMLDQAKKVIDANVDHFKDLVGEDHPLIGIEPSAILGFRDEYPRLAEDQDAARNIAGHSHTVEEFLAAEYEKKKIRSDQFISSTKKIRLHGHCHQKSLSNMASALTALSIPENYEAVLMNTGCCGMAGSFGYEKEHYELSMQVGEESLFPKVRRLSKDVVVAASGTSCRHQIKDGTDRAAVHPISLLRAALK